MLGSPVPRGPAGRWHAALEIRRQPVPDGVENLAFGLRLSEYHTGLRAYCRRLLETISYRLNSDDFVFDQELIAQVVAAGMRHRIGEIAVPTRYFEEASSVGFRRSVVYGLSTLRVVPRYSSTGCAPPLRQLAARRGPPAPATAGAVASPRLGRRRDRHLGGRGLARLRRSISRRRAGPGPRKPDWLLAPPPSRPPTCSVRGFRWQRLLHPSRPWRVSDAAVPADRLSREQRPARAARRADSLPLPRRPRRLQPGDRARHGGRRADRRLAIVVSIASLAIFVLSVRGPRRGAVLIGLALTGLLAVALAFGVAAHRFPGAERIARPWSGSHGRRDRATAPRGVGGHQPSADAGGGDRTHVAAWGMTLLAFSVRPSRWASAVDCAGGPARLRHRFRRRDPRGAVEPRDVRARGRRDPGRVRGGPIAGPRGGAHRPQLGRGHHLARWRDRPSPSGLGTDAGAGGRADRVTHPAGPPLGNSGAESIELSGILGPSRIRPPEYVLEP